MRDWNERNGKVSEVSRESRSRESKLARFPTFALKTRSSWERGLFLRPKFAEKPQRVKKKTTLISRARKTTGRKEGTFECDSYSFSSSSREKRERESAKRERRNVPWWQKCVISRVLEWGADAKRRAREGREKNKKNLIYENEWKKAKTTTKKAELGIHVEKKKGEQMKKGIEFPHFSNTLKLSRFTHTHTTKKTL